jgi:hypothetical protein
MLTVAEIKADGVYIVDTYRGKVRCGHIIPVGDVMLLSWRDHFKKQGYDYPEIDRVFKAVFEMVGLTPAHHSLWSALSYLSAKDKSYSILNATEAFYDLCRKSMSKPIITK